MEKQQKQLQNLTPSIFRLILICGMVLLLGVFAACFFFFRGQLDTYASQVKDDNYVAAVSSNDVSRLQDIQQELENDNVAVTRAKSIVADSQYYQYQNQIISDINQYAKTSGVTITSYTFNTDIDKKTPAQTASPNPLTIAPAGLKTLSTVVSVKSPVDYTAIMRFIHSIEINLTKMQLTGVSFIKGTSNTDVSVNPITIEVYTR
jgi:hypothetical protein